MLKRIVDESIKPLLKSHKFKKRRHDWNRDRGDFVDVISVQKSSYSDKNNEVFTVNLGIFVPIFYEAIWCKSPPAFVTEVDCAVRLRVGDLYEDRIDHWWTLNDRDSCESARIETVAAIKDLAIPFLDRFCEFDAIARHLRQLDGSQLRYPLMLLYRSLAEWRTGSRVAATRQLDEIPDTWRARADAVRAFMDRG